MHVNISAGCVELTQAGTVFFLDRKARLCTLLSVREGRNLFCFDSYTCDVFLCFFPLEKHRKVLEIAACILEKLDVRVLSVRGPVQNENTSS